MIKNKRIGILTIVVICLIGLVGIGVSYAYWRFTYMQTDKNIGISKCLTISLSEENNEINLNNIYPISDEEGRNLTPYSFKLTNTCSMSAEYLLNLEMLEGTTLNSKYLDVLVNNGNINLLSSFDNASTVITNSVEAKTLVKDILTPGASKEYTISLWMDKNVTLSDDVQNKAFKGKIVVNATAISTIVDNIVASLDTTGKCPTVNSDGTVNVTGAESENSLLCSAPDNYGKSYYFRGNVQNNYVRFANFYWRIVRINGDGSIRLIYDGTTAHENGEASTDRQIGTSRFNYFWHKDNKYDGTNSYSVLDNAGVGYMYGNRDQIVEQESQYYPITYDANKAYYVSKEYNYNERTDRFVLKEPISLLGSELSNDYIGYYTMNSTDATTSDFQVYKITSVTNKNSVIQINYGFVRYGTSSKEKAQKNINSSDVKYAVESWYNSNIKDTTYELYFSDNIFCNDRQVSVKTTDEYTNLGYGPKKTYYRWNYAPWSDENYNKKVYLSCFQTNDSFTVNDTLKGNGALKYPIGLISSDELVMAGGWSNSNSNYYLYTGQYYWGMSAHHFDGANASSSGVSSDGSISMNWNHYIYGVKPVINLKSDSLKSGEGTINNPYIVE